MVCVTAELMKQIGVKRFSMSFIDGIGRGSNLRYPDNFSLSNCSSNYFHENMELVNEVYSKYKDIVYSKSEFLETHPEIPIKKDNCGAGWRSIVVQPNGDITSCQYLGKSLILGNLLNNDITEIFNRSGKNIIYRTFSKLQNEECCSNCINVNYCANCITKILLANRDFKKQGKDICPIAKRFNFDKYFNDFKFELSYNI
jgi:radical SAM protein with 4Fe4S-binding SPASM domain